MNPAGVSHRPAICSKLLQYLLFDHRDKWRCMTAAISRLSDIHRKFFEGQDVFLRLSQNIPWISHATDANIQIMLYIKNNYSHFGDS